MPKEHEFKPKRIAVSGKKQGLPYSKGLMAASIMATGLSPGQAYDVAEKVEKHLIENKISSVGASELRNIAADYLKRELGSEYAKNYLRWQSLGKLEKPLIILIGGTTGVGKSTIATEVAHRLGITRIVSTDALREVMRAIFSKELMPALYNSTFNAWQVLRTPLPADVDPVIAGFREQTAAVVVGIRAVIERSIKEGLNVVVEGAHVVPGFISSEYFRNAFVVQLVIGVRDAEVHRSHFHIRELETEGFRPYEKYRANFESIRRIGEYIESLTKEEKLPLVYSESLDETVVRVLGEISRNVITSKEIETKTK